MALQLFRTLKPVEFSKSAYSAVVPNLDVTDWEPIDLTDFVFEQMAAYAATDDADNILLWSIFLAYCKSKGATAFTKLDVEDDEVVAVVFPVSADPVVTEALVFDQELDHVTAPDPDEIAAISDLVKKALGG
jgi:hypothetical protein